MKKKPVRVPVDFDFTALNWDFIELMANIPPFADVRYKEAGGWPNYTRARLRGEKSPLNHAMRHITDYIRGKQYDHFDKKLERHLAAAAYNLMMEFFYLRRFGNELHPLAIDEAFLKVRDCAGGSPRHGSPQGVKKLRKKRRK